jgi:hypothetical protein
MKRPGKERFVAFVVPRLAAHFDQDRVRLVGTIPNDGLHSYREANSCCKEEQATTATSGIMSL